MVIINSAIMKKLRYILMLLAVVMLAGCEKETSDSSLSEGIKVKAGFDASTRTSFTEGYGAMYVGWNGGDAIGISAANQSNIQYKAKDTSSNSIFLAATSVVIDAPDRSAAYAYYPYNKEFDAEKNHAGIMNTSVQNHKDGLKEYDFLYASTEVSDNMADFKFKHLFSFLKITIPVKMIEERGTDGGLHISSTAELACVNSMFDLSAGSIADKEADASSEIRYIIPADYDFGDAESINCYVAILPQKAGETIAISLLKDGEVSKRLMINNVPDRAFVAGNMYAVSLSGESREELLSKEKAALIELYNATNGSNWANNSNWNSDVAVKNWHGIKINSLGYVTEINLMENNLKGELPASIGNFTCLEKLLLRSNNISGELPESIGKLVKLTELDVMNNQLSGSIPESIGSLTLLKILRLNINNFTGSLPESFGNLINVEKVYMHENQITGPIPESLAGLASITDFVLAENKFTGELPEVFGTLKTLVYLNLSDNQFTGSIPVSFANLTEMENLYLYNNSGLSGDVPKSIQQTFYWVKCWISMIYNTGINKTNLDIPAPSIASVTTSKGNRIPEDVYKKNKLTLLYNWKSTGSTNKNTLQLLRNLYARHQRNGLEIYGFTSEDESVIPDFEAEYKPSWENFSMISRNNRDYFKFVSLVTPTICAVDQNGKIVYSNMLTSMSKLNSFVNDYMTEEEPVELYTSTDYSQDGVVTQLQRAIVGNGIDIVLMGDAYSDRLIADGTYKRVMEKAARHLLSEEPYKTYKDMFNIYMVNVVSPNEVYEPNSLTSLGTYFGDGTHVGGDDNKCFNYALKAISEERLDDAMVVVMMNKDAYAGTCYMRYPSRSGDYGDGLSVAYFPTNSDDATFAAIIHHEVNGHGFAKLADEYAYENMGAIPADVQAENAGLFKYGWFKNADFTNDRNAVKWSKFLNDSRYQYDGLGLFEGGFTYWTGVWRPTENSIMRHNTGGFNAPSREAIYYRMHKLAYGDSWVYDYEKFVEYDRVNRKTSAATRVPYRAEESVKMAPLAPPVFINKSWRESMNKQ